jgi:flavin-dependent dehydrogenase
MNDYDVIVVGAGLAGLQCARLLGKASLRVLLVDRKNTLDDAIHTTGIFVRRTLEEFDLPEDCLGAAIRHVTLYSPKRRQLQLESPHAEFRIGKMARLYRRYLDHCERAGVEWAPNTRFAGLKLTEDKIVVSLQTGAAVRSVSARFIVGADGAVSRVARYLNLDQNREWIYGVEDVFNDVRLDGPPRLHCFVDRKLAPGYLAWVAHDGEEAHVGVGGYGARFEPILALERFRGSLKSIINLSGMQPLERRCGRIPVGGVLRKICSPYGLLVGDAAGAVSPLTAGGLDPCMRLSTLAAKVISEYLESNDETVLSLYSGELFRTRFASRLWMRRLISSLDHPALLELACASLHLPVLNAFAWHVFFGRGSFPDVDGNLSAELVS